VNAPQNTTNAKTEIRFKQLQSEIRGAFTIDSSLLRINLNEHPVYAKEKVCSILDVSICEETFNNLFWQFLTDFWNFSKSLKNPVPPKRVKIPFSRPSIFVYPVHLH
jgi:hypothetical protein